MCRSSCADQLIKDIPKLMVKVATEFSLSMFAVASAGITGWLVSAAGAVEAVELRLGDLTADERQIILDGCLINFYNHN